MFRTQCLGAAIGQPPLLAGCSHDSSPSSAPSAMAHKSKRGWSTRMMALVCLSSYVSACHSWRTEPVAPQESLADNPHEARVFRTDGSKLVLRGPSIVADTLHGLGKDSVAALIPLQQVDSIQVKRPDAVKTVLTVLGIAVVAAGAVVGWWAHECSNGNVGCD